MEVHLELLLRCLETGNLLHEHRLAGVGLRIVKELVLEVLDLQLECLDLLHVRCLELLQGDFVISQLLLVPSLNLLDLDFLGRLFLLDLLQAALLELPNHHLKLFLVLFLSLTSLVLLSC